MKKRIIYAIASVCLIIIGFISYYIIENKNEGNEIVVNAEVDLDLSAESSFLMEYSTGKVLYKSNETKKMAPASMTKMMGLLLVCEALESKQINLEEIVCISSEAASMGGSQVFLEPLEQISVDELIKCVCIASANDAMYALSELIGSSNTNFINVTGFDDENHYSCAKDMAIIAKELLKHEDIILPYTSTYDAYIRENTDSPFWLVNTNKMVKFYQGMDGLKTGYTSKAGFCLTSTAKRNNVRLISVVMKSQSSEIRSADTRKLLDYGFSKVKLKKLYNKDSVITTIKVNKAKNDQIDLYTVEDVNLIYEGNLDESDIEKQIILNDNCIAPINKGSIVGYLLIKYDNQEYKYPLIIKEDIESLSIKELIGKYILDILF